MISPGAIIVIAISIPLMGYLLWDLYKTEKEFNKDIEKQLSYSGAVEKDPIPEENRWEKLLK